MADQDNALDTIAEHRVRIDEIDGRIVALLNERAREALAIRALKPQAQLGLFDPRREEEICERVASLNEGPLYSDDLRAIYGVILKVSKEMHA
ncbi:MAG: chorismate mutase [Coriobacteriales bacterium]|jgi:chorismate mutase|nr:chorismate mutase [Coriobacteriales bacterium]